MLKLLCVTDLMSESSPALERARMLAETLSANLLVLRVVAATESPEVWEQSLRSETDLLVIDAEARRSVEGALEALLVGEAPAERVCPVLIVDRPPEGEAGCDVLVVPAGVSRQAVAALRWAAPTFGRKAASSPSNGRNAQIS